ncbi:hypothetical protein L2E82_49211 [Cichorium intybus]|uniref:Uncharacterized protein n=1 Tax=Cichorium intybus TaxID=13427 RepID=A0ACB8Z0A2_CICIN|nr:hypothetical protein L2E82_49211 [Cichorium intybus]
MVASISKKHDFKGFSQIESLYSEGLPLKLEDKFSWLRDYEFARQALAGVNPVNIEKLRVFPPVCQLDPAIYGQQESALKEEHISGYLNGMTVKMIDASSLCNLTSLLLFYQHHRLYFDSLPPHPSMLFLSATNTAEAALPFPNRARDTRKHHVCFLHHRPPPLADAGMLLPSAEKISCGSAVEKTDRGGERGRLYMMWWSWMKFS